MLGRRVLRWTKYGGIYVIAFRLLCITAATCLKRSTCRVKSVILHWQDPVKFLVAIDDIWSLQENDKRLRRKTTQTKEEYARSIGKAEVMIKRRFYRATGPLLSWRWWVVRSVSVKSWKVLVTCWFQDAEHTTWHVQTVHAWTSTQPLSPHIKRAKGDCNGVFIM